MSLSDVSALKSRFPGLRLLDKNEILQAPRDVVLSNGKPQIFVFDTEFAVSLDREDATKEISMMKQADGLSIPVVGVVIDGTIVDGYIMPLASPIPTAIPVTLKKNIMRQMLDLIEELHGRGILHGDLKLSNFLWTSEDHVRLCDFEEAQYVGSEHVPKNPTLGYRPPWRVAADDEPPLSLDDEYYALGLAVWELFTGHRVFEDLDPVDSEAEYVIDGVVVDVNEMNDTEAIGVVWDLLEKGGRGTIRRDTTLVYKVTGLPYESITTAEYHNRRALTRNEGYFPME